MTIPASFEAETATAATERVVICKQGPTEAVDRTLFVCGPGWRVEHVRTLAEALELCLLHQVDHLIVNMFSFTSAELTSLLIFRELEPRQRIVLFCDDEAMAMLSAAGLADECHAIKVEREKEHPRRRSSYR